MKKIVGLCLFLLFVSCEQQKNMNKIVHQEYTPCNGFNSLSVNDALDTDRVALTWYTNANMLYLEDRSLVNCGLDVCVCESQIDDNKIVLNEYFSGEEDANCLCEGSVKVSWEIELLSSYVVYVNRFVENEIVASDFVYMNSDTLYINILE